MNYDIVVDDSAEIKVGDLVLSRLNEMLVFCPEYDPKLYSKIIRAEPKPDSDSTGLSNLKI